MADVVTARLRLRPINEQDVNAGLNEVRDPSWALTSGPTEVVR